MSQDPVPYVSPGRIVRTIGKLNRLADAAEGRAVTVVENDPQTARLCLREAETFRQASQIVGKLIEDAKG